jgi:ABC-type microcin C transport system permease subunit YejE
MSISIFGTVAGEGTLNLGNIDNIYASWIRLYYQLIFNSNRHTPVFYHLLILCRVMNEWFSLRNNFIDDSVKLLRRNKFVEARDNFKLPQEHPSLLELIHQMSQLQHWKKNT